MPEPTPSQNGQNGATLALRFRLKKGVSSASDEALDGAIEWLEKAELFFGGLVFVGLALEVVFAIFHPPYDSFLERWGAVACDALVAIGVLGEIVASRRVTICQGEQLKRSDARLATAEKDAAETRERAAEIERVHGWRHVTPEFADAIRQALVGLAPHVSLAVEFQRSDPEAMGYSRELIDAFRGAGVPDPTHWRANEFLAGFIFGVNLWTDPKLALEPLAWAFIGHAPGRLLTRPADGIEQAHNVYVFVGTKDPWIKKLAPMPNALASA